MTFTAIEYMGRRDAERLPAHRDTVVVSVTDLWRPEAVLASGWRAVLRLRFGDVDFDGVSLCDGGQPIWGLPIEQAVELVHWLDGWNERPYGLSLIAHCEGGISRSAAVGQFAAVRYQLPLPHGSLLANRMVLRRLQQAALILSGTGADD